MIRIIGNYIINLELACLEKPPKVLHYIKHNKFDLLTNEKSGNMIYGSFRHSFSDMWILRIPHHVTLSPSHIEQHRGKAPEVHS
jgi:hypothetical protein